MPFNFLTEAEGTSADEAIEELRRIDWANELLSVIEHNGGVSFDNTSFLFELRFAIALHSEEIVPTYEAPGEAKSTLDFEFTHNDQKWRIELLRLNETMAARNAIQKVQVGLVNIWRRVFSSGHPNNLASEEGETLKAVQRICQKCARKGRPHKFPAPDGAIHVLLIDARTLLSGTTDMYDWIHIGLGGEYLTQEFHRRYWEGTLISGVFNSRTTVHGAKWAQERLHLIGFMKEEQFGVCDFGSSIKFVANPFLFDSMEDLQNTLAKWPLEGAQLLNR